IANFRAINPKMNDLYRLMYGFKSDLPPPSDFEQALQVATNENRRTRQDLFLVKFLADSAKKDAFRSDFQAALEGAKDVQLVLDSAKANGVPFLDVSRQEAQKLTDPKLKEQVLLLIEDTKNAYVAEIAETLSQCLSRIALSKDASTDKLF